MAKRRTKKYHRKRNTYKRRQTYKRRNTYKKRKRTNRKKLTGGAKAVNAVKSLFGPKITSEQQEKFNELYKTHNHSVETSTMSTYDALGVPFAKGELLHFFKDSEGDIEKYYAKASFDKLKRACGEDCQEKEQAVATPAAQPVPAPAAVQAGPVAVQASSDPQISLSIQQLSSKLKELELKLGNQVKSELEDLRGRFVSALNTLNSRLVGDISKINTDLVAEINKINSVLEEHSDKMLHPQAYSKLGEYIQRFNKTLEELKNKQAKLETSLRSLETSQPSTETSQPSIYGSQGTEDFSNLLGLTSQPVAPQVAPQPVAPQVAPQVVQPVAQQPVAPQVAPQVVQPVAQQPVAPQPVASQQPMDLSFMEGMDYTKLNQNLNLP